MKKTRADILKDKVKFSIKLKFFTLICLMIVFISVSLVIIFVTNARRELIREIEKRGISEAKTLAHDVKYGMLTGDKELLNQLIIGRMKNPDIVFVQIIGDDKQTLAEDRKKRYSMLSGKRDMPIEIEEGVYNVAITTEKGEKVYEISAPILIGVASSTEKETALLEDILLLDEDEERAQSQLVKRGYVKIGISLKNIERKMVRIITMISIFIISIVIFISIIISLIFENIIVKPIKRVTQAAREISEGDLTKSVDVSSRDEIGIMARSFNKMTNNLKSTINELEAKNIELERFVYTVSHDLKSPLITIKGFLGMLENDFDKGDSGRIKDDMKRIHAAADRMEQLLKELLELSRIGRQVNLPEEVQMVMLAREAMKLVDGQINKLGVQLEISPNLPVAIGDYLRLLEVYQNLFDNAVKYMGEQPSPHIEVGARQDRGTNVYYVCDNGIGIDPCYHEKIFSLFERLDNKTEGTGVGLALVKRIIEVHGGNVWVESRGRGKGSTFCFTIPKRGEST